jgi:hypothetical protein
MLYQKSLLVLIIQARPRDQSAITRAILEFTSIQVIDDSQFGVGIGCVGSKHQMP